jgi:hypothetical protein
MHQNYRRYLILTQIVIACLSLLFVGASASATTTKALVLKPCASTINFGETMQCAISVAAEVDTASFTASANDRVIIRLTQVTGTVWPEFDVTQQGTAIDVCGGISQATCTLPNTATYIISVSDRNGPGTGDYNLYIQRYNNPGNADPVSYGIDYQRTLTVEAQIDTSTFTAQANDVILIRMVRSSGTPNPKFDVYDPDGTFVCGGLGASARCEIPSDGLYTILSQGNGGAGPLGYYLYLQRLNNPGNAVIVKYGETRNSAFIYPNQVGSFAFTGLANEKVVVRMAKVTGTIYPKFSVYSPTGSHICGGVAGSVAQATCTLPLDGVYTIITDDQAGGNLGSYTVNIVCQVGICGIIPAVYVPRVER